MSKPEFWTFAGSTWAAAPELALIEYGLANKVEKKSIAILDAENLNVFYVQKTGGTATVPFILDNANGVRYTSTKEVVKYLLSQAPPNATHGVKTNEWVVDAVHDDKHFNIDPNLFLIGARSPEELSAKRNGLPGRLLNNRLQVLQAAAKDAPQDLLKSFYLPKIEYYTATLEIFKEGASDSTTAPFFAVSKENWDNAGTFIYKLLPAVLEKGTPFIGGERPGEADFHLAAWLARVGQVVGAGTAVGAWKGLSALKDGKEVPAEVAKYWDSWAGRESWKTVYP